MGASDPSRPDKTSGLVQVLLCALVLGTLAIVTLGSPSADMSGDVGPAPSIAECVDGEIHLPSTTDGCGAASSERIEPAAASDQQASASVAPVDVEPLDREPRHAVQSASRTTDLNERREYGAAARVKFSAACQSGDLREDLRCIEQRRDDRFADVDETGPSGDAGPRSRLGISGRVLDEDGMGVAGIAVVATLSRTYADQTAGVSGEAVPGRQSIRLRTSTDSLGAYGFHGLEDGDYELGTEARDGYRNASMSVRAGVSYADLILVRERTIEITGQVKSSEGEPLEGVVVLPVVIGVASVTTDRDGRYRLPVRHDPRATALTLRFQLAGFNETYASLPSARLAGDEVVGVDASLEPVGQWTMVSGVVAGSDGSVLAGRHVQLRPSGQMRTYRATTDGNGEFVFPAVEAGIDYRLQVSGDPGYEDYERSVTVTVDEADFAIIVDPYEFGKLTGRMVNRDGAPVPEFNLLLKNAASVRPNAVVSSDLDGNFTIDNAPAGELAFVSHATPSVLVRGVRLDPGDTLHVPLVIDWGEHEIRGLVVDRRGNPVPASRIVLKWNHRDDQLTSSTTRRTAADAQGNFLFSQLGPGPHRLEIDAPGHGPVRLDHDASRDGYEVLVRLN